MMFTQIRQMLIELLHTLLVGLDTFALQLIIQLLIQLATPLLYVAAM